MAVVEQEFAGVGDALDGAGEGAGGGLEAGAVAGEDAAEADGIDE